MYPCTILNRQASSKESSKLSSKESSKSSSKSIKESKSTDSDYYFNLLTNNNKNKTEKTQKNININLRTNVITILEEGKKAFDELLYSAKPYLEFLYDTLKNSYDIQEPSEKNRLIQEIRKRIQEFKDPILIHESLKKLAHLADIPERLLGIYNSKIPRPLAKTESSVDKDHILDTDVLRFYYLTKKQKLPSFELFTKNDLEFCSESASKLYEAIKNQSDLETMPFMTALDTELHPYFEALFDKKINRLKLEEGSKEAIYKLLERAWLKKRLTVQEEIEKATEEKDQLKLTLKLTLLLKSPPQITL